MGISVFLSYPLPFRQVQEEFVAAVRRYLEGRGFTPRTLGVTDWDMDAPLKAIRRMMMESNGLITIAFKRTFIERGSARPDPDIPRQETLKLDGYWMTTPWAHIEPAMAYQVGLPSLILRERYVFVDGLLDRGVMGLYMPEFDLDPPDPGYFNSAQWNNVLGKWEGYVRNVVERKGHPPPLF